MKLLLTGAFGNIGVQTLRELLDRGHEVRCFDLKTPANEKTAARFGRSLEVRWGDIRSPEEVAAAVLGREAVIHLAFVIPPASERRPGWAREINVQGTVNLLTAMRASPRPAKIVFASSVTVFGQRQDQPPPRRASEPIAPCDHYTRHKAQCEQAIEDSGLAWTILRLGAAPPAELGALDPLFFEIPLANRIEFVHPRDAGLAMAKAVTSSEVWGKVLLIGGGSGCQLYERDFVQPLMRALGVGDLPEAAFGTIPYYSDWMDTDESQRLLDYQRHSLTDFVQDIRVQLSWKRRAIGLFRPLVRAWILRKSPYWAGSSSSERSRALRKRGRASWRGGVAVVTGASSGIGAATARKLAAEGLKIVIVARRQDRLEDLAAEIKALGGEALPLVVDLSDEAERVRLFRVVSSAYGPVDVLVNNAGLGWYGFGAEMPWSLAKQMAQVNVTAVLHLTLLFLPGMRSRNCGHVINVGSIAGDLPSQGVALYGATKSFLSSFTTALYRELRGTNVHVSVVKPGPVTTEFFDTAAAQPAGFRVPAERLGVTPEKVANRIWDLLKRPRRFSYVPRFLGLVPWVEFSLGWLIDRLGPLLLKSRMPAPLPQAGKR